MVSIKKITCSVATPKPGQTVTITVEYETGYWWSENTQSTLSYTNLDGNPVEFFRGDVSGNPGTNTLSKQLTIPFKVGESLTVTARVSKGPNSDIDYETITIPLAVRQPSVTATASDYTPRPDTQVTIALSGVVDYRHTNVKAVLGTGLVAPTTKALTPNANSGAVAASIPLQVDSSMEGSSIPVTISLTADDPVMGPDALVATFNLTLDVVRMLVCEYCSQRFETEGDLAAHKASKHGYACTYCGQTFATSGQLAAHISGAHPPTKEYYCDICGAGPFSTPYAMQQHRLEHETFTCEQCGATFTTQAKLNGHIQTAHGEAFVCPTCQASFTTQAALTTHVNAAHSNQYICAKCGLPFASRGALDEHMASAHPDTPATDWTKYLPYVAVGVVGIAGLAVALKMGGGRSVRS